MANPDYARPNFPVPTPFDRVVLRGRREEGIHSVWPLNEGVGATCYDINGSANGGNPFAFYDATLTNGPTRVFADVGWQVQFTGSGSKNIFIFSMGWANGSPPPGYTFCAWIKPKTFTNAYQGLFGSNYNGEGYRILYVLVKSNGKLAVFGGDPAAQTNYDGSGTYTLLVNEWAFVVATWSSGTGAYKGYINGMLDGASPSGNVPDIYTLSCYIGYDACTPNREFDGTMREVTFYNRALSGDEIARLYRNYLTPSPLRGSRSFNAPSGSPPYIGGGGGGGGGARPVVFTAT